MLTESQKAYLRNWSKNPKRKKWMREWKEKNKEHINKWQRDYYALHGRKRGLYTPKSPQPSKNTYAGKCGLGRKYEILAQSLLKKSKFALTFHDSFDLEWNGLKIDVKIRNKNKRGNYGFSTTPKCTANYFLCFCVDIKIKYIFLIPSSVYKTGVTLTDQNIENKFKQYLFKEKEQ